MSYVDLRDLYKWCKIPGEELPEHPDLRVRFRIVRDSDEMGQLMAREFVELIHENNTLKRPTRAIVPCGPNCWYKPFTEMVNSKRISLRHLFVFHMDECLDWQGHPLPTNHPYNFRTFMEKHFYGGITADLAVPESQRFWLLPSTIDRVRAALEESPVDVTIGGWDRMVISLTIRLADTRSAT